MGTTFVVMTTLKLATMGATGIGIISAFKYFLDFEFKSNKKGKEHGGDSDVSSAIDSIRTKSRSIG